MATPNFTTENEIPYGYCQCGCGQKTPLYKTTKKSAGRIKGEVARFLKHHGKSRARTHEQVVSDFWSKVAIRANDDLCWEWLASKNKKGYGYVGIGEKRMVKAHRFAWAYPDYVIPDGLHVLHSCDNPSCCNPKHLFLGTQMDNIKDMISKKRDHFLTGLKLTSKEVLEIRSRYKVGGVSQSALAKEFKVSHSNISFIIHRKTWKDLSDE